MGRRYFRGDADNRLVMVSDDDAMTAPTGRTAIALADLVAVYSGDILVGGIVTGSGTVADPYVYTPPAGQATVADDQRYQIYAAYHWWRIHGRTQHWAGIRGTRVDNAEPLMATDKWVYHIVALIDRIISGEVFATKTAVEVQAAVDHADNILRTLGPTWYIVQIGDQGNVSENGEDYRDMSTEDGALIYTDIMTAAGLLRGVDGTFNGMPTTIRAGFNPEIPTLGV